MLLSKDEPPIKEQLKIDGRVIELDTEIIDNSSLSIDDINNNSDLKEFRTSACEKKEECHYNPADHPSEFIAGCRNSIIW